MSIPGKDPVHKCHSDPGQNVTPKNTNLCCKNKYSTKRNVTTSSNLVNTNVVLPPPTRKCVLTLDGYSYVIGKSKVKKCFQKLQLYNLYLIKNQKSASEN